jgi:hypothetical protein
MKTPYKQGSIDGMCGYYSIINAIHYLKPNITEKKAEKLLRELVITNKMFFYMNYLDGIYFENILSLTKNISILDSTLTFTPLFEDDVFEDVYEYLSCLEEHMADNKVCILSVGNPWHHWTVLTKIHKEKITLFDSYYGNKTISFDMLSLKRKKHMFKLHTDESLLVTYK